MSSTLFAGATPLVIFVAKATLVLIAALAATTFLRRGTAGERHLVWLAALVGVLALPVLSRIPALQIGILPSSFSSDETPSFARLAPTVAPNTLGPDVAPVVAPLTAIAGTPSPATPLPTYDAPPAPATLTPMLPSVLQTLAIVWAAVAFSFLGWLVFGAFQVRRIVRNGVELTSPDWTTPLCEVADRIDLEQPPRLVISEGIEMAFACRALAPTIVLPASAESWTDERRRAVLFHELAHVKRHDLVAHTLGRVACALYWFHPLVWTAAKQLRAESEKACDDLVLSCGARPSEYAQHLLDMVTSVRSHGAPVMALPMARKREFEGRMLAILDPAIRRAAPSRTQAATVVAAVGALSLTIAAAAPAPAAEPVVSPAPSLASLDTLPKRRSRTRDESSAAGSSVADTSDERRDAAVGSSAASGTSAASGSSAGYGSSAAYGVSSAGYGVASSAEKLGREAGNFATNVVTQTLKQLAVSVQTSSSESQHVDTARVALLIRVLATDADASVRRSAAWALNDAHTSAAEAALIRTLSTDTDADVREMCAWALGDMNADAAVNALATALLRDKSPRVRATAAWALGENDRHSSTDALVSAISDGDQEVRRTAIWALGQSDLHRAPTALVNALSDNSPRVREVAAWSLGQIEDSVAVRALARAFESETDPRVKTTYLWALGNIGNVPTSVLETAMKSSDADLRRHAVAMLAGNGAWPWPWPWPQPRPNP